VLLARSAASKPSKTSLSTSFAVLVSQISTNDWQLKEAAEVRVKVSSKTQIGNILILRISGYGRRMKMLE